MLRPFATLLLAYYSLGALLLGGNFGMLVGLPSMYAHCKANEDKDLGPLDFITDHLVCIDALFDSHPPGDEQRPHSGKNQHYTSIQSYTALNKPITRVAATLFTPSLMLRGEVPDCYRFEFSALVFRPPCA
ncbi:MAG: hypothetical protein ABI599_15020 [Flavobacteriales bacterium]